MKYSCCKLLAAWAAGAGLLLAQTAANAETPLPGTVKATSALQTVPVQPYPLVTPYIPAQPTPSHPMMELPEIGPSVPAPAFPHLDPSYEPVSGKASCPCLRDRIRCLLDRLYTPWPSITW
jgi:hypothetical protein